MSNEAQINSSLQITFPAATANLNYARCQPASFNADVGVAIGPTPGAIHATVDGTDVDLSKLTTPGLCRIMNQDPTNFVTVGIWDPDNTEFYPLLDLLPGESYVFRLSRHLGKERLTPGTGTYGSTCSLRIAADMASCWTLVEAFNK